MVGEVGDWLANHLGRLNTRLIHGVVPPGEAPQALLGLGTSLASVRSGSLSGFSSSALRAACLAGRGGVQDRS